MILTPSMISSLNVISCMSRKQKTTFETARQKIIAFNNKSWKDIGIEIGNSKTASLDKNNKAETTASWESIMNAIGLNTEEKELVVNISSSDNILDSEKPEEITFTLKLTPKLDAQTREVTIAATWICEGSEEVADNIITTINDEQKIIIRGDNLNQDANDATTKKAILSKIGLSETQQKYVRNITGTLAENKYIKLTYDIDYKVFKTATNEVQLQRYNQSLENTYKEEFDINSFKIANQLTLINNK